MLKASRNIHLGSSQRGRRGTAVRRKSICSALRADPILTLGAGLPPRPLSPMPYSQTFMIALHLLSASRKRALQAMHSLYVPIGTAHKGLSYIPPRGGTYPRFRVSRGYLAYMSSPPVRNQQCARTHSTMESLTRVSFRQYIQDSLLEGVRVPPPVWTWRRRVDQGQDHSESAMYFGRRAARH